MHIIYWLLGTSGLAFLVPSSLEYLGMRNVRAKEYALARDMLQLKLRILGTILPHHHPEVCRASYQLSLVLMELNDYASARDTLQQALSPPMGGEIIEWPTGPWKGNMIFDLKSILVKTHAQLGDHRAAWELQKQIPITEDGDDDDV